MKKQTKIKNCNLLVFVTMLLLTSCHTYYKAIQVNTNTPIGEAATIDSLKQSERYFILRNGSESFFMKKTTLSDDKKTINCILDPVADNHQLYLANGQNGKKKYKKNNPMQLPVLDEVHFYIQPDSVAVPGMYNLQLSQIQKIEVIEKDKKRTTTSYILGTIGITLGALALPILIYMAAYLISASS